MFWHNLKYEFRVTIRNKDFIMWLMLFPIVLGTLFKVAFGSIYEKNDLFSAIPVAVVKTAENPIYDGVLAALTEGDDAALSVTFVNDEEAKELLFGGKADGILYLGEKAELSVAGSGMSQTILKEITARIGVYETVLADATATMDPGKIEASLRALSAEINACREVPFTEGNPDVYVQFFYNLIGMVAICGSMSGLHVATNNQANQSALGARKNISPTPKWINLSADLTGSLVSQAVCMVMSVTFIRFILRIDLGRNLPLLYAAAILSGCLGVTLGFFIGSIGRLKHEAKSAISLSVSLFLCFLSGLMVGNMKAILVEKAPWVNKINPVAVMSDSYYCLNMYSDYRRFLEKVVVMLIYVAVFTVLGILFTRRKKYASI